MVPKGLSVKRPIVLMAIAALLNGALVSRSVSGRHPLAGKSVSHQDTLDTLPSWDIGLLQKAAIEQSTRQFGALRPCTAPFFSSAGETRFAA